MRRWRRPRRRAWRATLGWDSGRREGLGVILWWAARVEGKASAGAEALLAGYTGREATLEDVAWWLSQVRVWSPAGKIALLGLSMDVLLSSGSVLSPSRALALRLLADAVAASESRVDGMMSVRGAKSWGWGDPSDLSWWLRGEEVEERKGVGWGQALVRLGLTQEGSLTLGEVRAAYRRMARLYHPDRYMRLGEEARGEAGRLFGSIREAYEMVASALEEEREA